MLARQSGNSVRVWKVAANLSFGANHVRLGECPPGVGRELESTSPPDRPGEIAACGSLVLLIEIQGRPLVPNGPSTMFGFHPHVEWRESMAR